MDELKNDVLSAAGAENTDIQNKLYEWFKEEGHLDKMRAYFRAQLVASLNDGSARNTANNANAGSPEAQAFYLLLADFLMNREHLYTLSVFIAEVPLLSKLYKFSSYVDGLSAGARTTPVVKRGYHVDEVRDILETLDFRPDSDVVRLTSQYYFDARKDDPQSHSLLSCVFKAVTTIKNDLGYRQSNNVEETTYYKECLEKLEQLNNDKVEKVTDVEQMVFQRQQIENVTKQLQLEQKQLCRLINIYEEKEKSVRKAEEEYNKKLLDIKNKKNELRKKEINILKHEKILREKPLHHINENTTVIESNYVKLLQEQNIALTRQLQETKWKLYKFDTPVEQTSSNEISKDIQKFETSLDREMVSKLQRENNELCEFIKIQQQRIEELSNRPVYMANQTEKTHQVSTTTVTDHRRDRNVKKKQHNFLDNSTKETSYTNQTISSTTTTADHWTTVFESDDQTE